MRYFLGLLLLGGARAFACVEGSYAMVENSDAPGEGRLRVCEVIVTGATAYAGDPSNVQVERFITATQKDREAAADFTNLAGMSLADAKTFFYNETRRGHYRAKLTANGSDQVFALRRLANKMNEFYGMDLAVAYQQNRDTFERQRQPLVDPLAQLDRFGARNRAAMTSLNAACADKPKTGGDVVAVEMVYPVDGHRQSVVPIAITFEDGAKNHGRLHFVGREGVTSREISRQNGKFFAKDASGRQLEVKMNLAPLDTAVPKREAKDARGDACVVAALARRGEIKAAAAAAPAAKAGKSAAAQ